MAEGVENFHIQFGIDGGDADQAADYYTGAPSATELDDAVSARIYVLIRSRQATPGYTNTKTYHLGDVAVDPNPDDGFYRRVYSTTVQLRNPTNLRGF